MRYNFEIRFGKTGPQIARDMKVSKDTFYNWLKTRPELMEYAFLGYERGSMWIDFQDNLEKKGYLIIEKDGRVTYEKRPELTQLLAKYGIPSMAEAARLTNTTVNTIKKWFKERPELMQYVFWGMTYAVRFRPIEKAYKETVLKQEQQQ